MTVLLRVDASARLNRSITRELTQQFIDGWRSRGSAVQVLPRDIGQNPPSIVSEDWISAGFIPPEQQTQGMKDALTESMELISEVRRADVIVIGAPMYNYGLPGALKAWVDQIIRPGVTFSFDLGRGDFPIQSTLSGKTLVVLSSRGEFGFESGGIRDGWNHMSPHLRTIATRLLGIAEEEIYEIASEYQEFNDERHERSRERAMQDAAELGARLAMAGG